MSFKTWRFHLRMFYGCQRRHAGLWNRGFQVARNRSIRRYHGFWVGYRNRRLATSGFMQLFSHSGISYRRHLCGCLYFAWSTHTSLHLLPK